MSYYILSIATKVFWIEANKRLRKVEEALLIALRKTFAKSSLIKKQQRRISY